jgi:hypothetical protein
MTKNLLGMRQKGVDTPHNFEHQATVPFYVYGSQNATNIIPGSHKSYVTTAKLENLLHYILGKILCFKNGHT